MEREHNSAGHVVWINGAFGSGKATTAPLLVNAVPGSVLVDPEEVGTLLRDVLQPVAPVRDYQQCGAWRELVAATLNSVVRELPEVGPGLVVAPQTISSDEYWSEIVSALDPGCRITAVALQTPPSPARCGGGWVGSSSFARPAGSLRRSPASKPQSSVLRARRMPCGH